MWMCETSDSHMGHDLGHPPQTNLEAQRGTTKTVLFLKEGVYE